MIVNTNISCNSVKTECYLKLLMKKYPKLEVFPIGRSVCGKQIFCAAIGEGESASLIVGAHHSLEWITSLLLLKYLETFLQALENQQQLLYYDIQYIFSTRRLYIIPMLNPDGVDLVINGLSVDCPYYGSLITQNNNFFDFSKNWQANIRGVDLNHNYDALWQNSKNLEKDYGVYGPGPTRFSGPFPESEPEVAALCNFVRKVPLRHATAYHTQGEEIYARFNHKAPKSSQSISNILSSVSGYTLLDNAEGIASYAGFKDWVIDKINIPGFTIEAGLGKNPLPLSRFDSLYDKNLEMLLLLSLL